MDNDPTNVAFRDIYRRLNALEKRINALEAVQPVTKGNIDSDSIFDAPCTCLPDGQPCPSCVRKSQSEHGDEIPF